MVGHQLSLSDDAIKRVVGFLGYGRASAPVWFIGLEEGLGDAKDDEAIINLKARTQFERTMDLAVAHRALREGGEPIEIETKDTFTQVWVWMAKIMRSRAGNVDWQDTEAAKTYIRQHLGRRNGETFLTEVSPIPSRKQRDKWLLEWFQKKLPDLDQMLKKRRESLYDLFRRHNPSLVVCYGSGDTARRSFQEMLSPTSWETFAELEGKRRTLIEASPNRRVLLLPFFGNGHMKHSVIETLITREAFTR
jgi:hypothetical protein